MILHFIITVLVIYGIKASFSEGMIFYPVYVWMVSKLDRVFKMHTIVKIMKPLFDCTPCMASIYGSFSFLVSLGDFPKPLLLSWAVWVFSLAGFNYLINKIINK